MGWCPICSEMIEIREYVVCPSCGEVIISLSIDEFLESRNSIILPSLDPAAYVLTDAQPNSSILGVRGSF